MKPELLALSNVEWQLFYTFTFKRERMTEATRQRMFFALLRTQAGNFGVHFKQRERIGSSSEPACRRFL